MSTAAASATGREPVAGNRLMLAGALLYLLEWVAIIPAGNTGPSELGKTSTAAIVKLYTDNAKGAGFIAGWCTVVLFGRVLLILGVKRAVAGTRHAVFADWAVGAMAASVAVEIVDVALVAGISHGVAAGSLDDSVVVALDAISALLFYAVIGALGVAVATAAFAMRASRRFPAWISWVGLAAGVLAMASAVLLGASGGEDNSLRAIGMGAQLGVPLFWIWMLAGGIYLWRAPRETTLE